MVLSAYYVMRVPGGVPAPSDIGTESWLKCLAMPKRVACDARCAAKIAKSYAKLSECGAI